MKKDEFIKIYPVEESISYIHRLKENGIPVDAKAITVDGAVEEIYSVYASRFGGVQ